MATRRISKVSPIGTFTETESPKRRSIIQRTSFDSPADYVMYVLNKSRHGADDGDLNFGIFQSEERTIITISYGHTLKGLYTIVYYLLKLIAIIYLIYLMFQTIYK